MDIGFGGVEPFAVNRTRRPQRGPNGVLSADAHRASLWRLLSRPTRYRLPRYLELGWRALDGIASAVQSRRRHGAGLRRRASGTGCAWICHLYLGRHAMDAP